MDNVVVAIEPVKKGETVTYMCAGEEKRLTAAEDITIYHKLAACDIAQKAQPIVKYGAALGLAARDIKAGEHVHCTTARDTGKTWTARLRRRIRV